MCRSKVQVTLQLMVSQSVCLGIEHRCAICDQILLPVGMLLDEILWSCICAAPSLTRGRACRSQSYFTTDSRSVSMSCYRAPLWDLRPDITSCRKVVF
jgi:hypothetical protein